MSVLEWIVIIELVLLAIAGVMGLVGFIIARQDPNDPISVFCAAFWREFLWPPVVMPLDGARVAQRPGGGGGGGMGKSARAQEDDVSDDDAFYGRVRKGADGRALKSELVVLVEPHAAADAVVGREDGGIKVRVIGEAGESRSNKSLVEMVANAIGVKPYQVTLTKGHYQTRKTLQVQGLAPDELQQKLDALPESE